MKILFPIGYFFPSEYGGPSNSIYWIVKELKRLGIKPTIVATSKGVNKEKVSFDVWHESEFGKVMYCSNNKEKLPILSMMHSIKEIKNTDLIQLTSLFHTLSWIVAFFNLFYRKPIIWSVRGELFPTALKYNKWLKKFMLSIIKLVLMGRSITFHATSLSEVREIQKRFGNDVKLIFLPNYIEVKGSFEGNPDKYLSYIGRIHPIKGLENIVAALSINKKFLTSEFTFKIAGRMEGDYFKRLKSIIRSKNLEKKIIFVGHISGDEKLKFLSKSYFNFLVSYSENFGNVVLESLMVGTPIVASKGTPWSDLEQHKAGFYIENDVVSLNKILSTILDLPKDRYNFMRKNAYSYCIANFNIKNNIQNWVEQYSKMICEDGRN